MPETATAETDKPLNFTQFETLKAVARGEVTMTLARPGTWKCANGKDGCVVTSTMLPLLQRKLAVADATFTDGVRGCRVTAAGNEALSRANRHKPTKSR